jgi:Erv1 / Alr family
MPCACKNKKVNVPDNIEWGPIFWRLLHSFAERAGSAPMIGIRGDEIRAWKGLLTTLYIALPCDDCRTHCSTYLARRPVNIPDNYSDIREYIRRWLFDLHSDVDMRLGKPNLDYTQLTPIYGGLALRQLFNTLEVVMNRAIQGGAIHLLSWTNWAKHVKHLLGMYN